MPSSQIDLSKLSPKDRRKLDKISKIVDEGNFAILEHLLEIENYIEEIKGKFPDINNILEQIKGKNGVDGPQGIAGKDGNNGVDGRNGINGRNGKDGRDGKNGKDGISGKDGINGEKGDKGEPGDIKSLAPQEVRDLLELLYGDDRLDAKYIKNLDERIGLKINDVKNGFQFVGSPGSGGRVARVYDLSASLDGTTTTFALPANWRVISVTSSSAPFTFRPTVDFTFTDTSITFTSQIDPVSTLASGQTLTVVYSEP